MPEMPYAVVEYTEVLGDTEEEGREMTYDELKAMLLGDPGASYWLQDALRTLDQRDPVDALRDARTLVVLMEVRNRELVFTL